MVTDQPNVMTAEKKYDLSSQSNTKQRTILQIVIRIYQLLCFWAVMILILGCIPFFMYACFSPSLRMYALIYVFWMYYDRQTPSKEGRRFLWSRKANFWQVQKDYFPVKLIKTAELPPDTTYLFAAFPHGLWPHGIIVNISSDVTGFNKAFPGLTPYAHTIDAAYKLPLLRELLLFIGSASSSAESILHVLNGPPGNVSRIMVGGYQDLIRSSPGTHRIFLKNRKGFVKLALKAGSSLVPVYTFGETDLYDQIEWYLWLHKKQNSILRTFTIPLGKGPRRLSHLFGLLPYQRPVTTVVGGPIKLPKVEDPSEELVDKFHKIYVQELTTLFEKYKTKYASQGENATLIID